MKSTLEWLISKEMLCPLDWAESLCLKTTIVIVKYIKFNGTTFLCLSAVWPWTVLTRRQSGTNWQQLPNSLDYKYLLFS